ncbi:hypothetical protein BV898_15609, partial [Hypsibius exemplaris]
DELPFQLHSSSRGWILGKRLHNDSPSFLITSTNEDV